MTSRARHAALPLTLVAVCLLGAACSSSPTGEPSPAVMTTTSPTPPLSVSHTPDPIEQAKAEVLAVYRGFWVAQAKSMEDPWTRPDPGLARSATGPALNDAKVTLIANRRDGLKMRGRPVLTPTVVVDGAKARVHDCMDATNWYAVSARTGQRVGSVSQGLRLAFEVDATAGLVKGQWLVDTVKLLREKKC